MIVVVDCQLDWHNLESEAHDHPQAEKETVSHDLESIITEARLNEAWHVFRQVQALINENWHQDYVPIPENFSILGESRTVTDSTSLSWLDSNIR